MWLLLDTLAQRPQSQMSGDGLCKVQAPPSLPGGVTQAWPHLGARINHQKLIGEEKLRNPGFHQGSGAWVLDQSLIPLHVSRGLGDNSILLPASRLCPYDQAGDRGRAPPSHSVGSAQKPHPCARSRPGGTHRLQGRQAQRQALSRQRVAASGRPHTQGPRRERSCSVSREDCVPAEWHTQPSGESVLCTQHPDSCVGGAEAPHIRHSGQP